jgi:PHD/YefM family antitoxin component YafN of YafNO toxin-antitoxin module
MQEGNVSGLDAMQAVQFIGKGKKRYAVLSADDWEALVEWLETLDDLQTVRRALADLKAAGGDRQRAGWIRWETAAADLS